MSTEPRSDYELDRRLDALTRHTDPDPAIWREIETRLDRQTRTAPDRRDSNSTRVRRWTTGLAIAASVTGALVLGIVLLQSPSGPGGDSRARVFQLEQTAMQTEAPQPLPTLLPDAPESLMAAWAENQAAIDELERALQRDPENRLLLEFLAQARLRQARLVQHGISRPQTRSIDL